MMYFGFLSSALAITLFIGGIFLGQATAPNARDAAFWEESSNHWHAQTLRAIEAGERAVVVAEGWQERAIACETKVIY